MTCEPAIASVGAKRAESKNAFNFMVHDFEQGGKTTMGRYENNVESVAGWRVDRVNLS